MNDSIVKVDRKLLADTYAPPGTFPGFAGGTVSAYEAIFRSAWSPMCQVANSKRRILAIQSDSPEAGRQYRIPWTCQARRI